MRLVPRRNGRGLHKCYTRFNCKFHSKFSHNFFIALEVLNSYTTARLALHHIKGQMKMSTDNLIFSSWAFQQQYSVQCHSHSLHG
jgi:hypothetical protein